ncbi:hypothetical protein [Halobacterium jilantaiense]|uniref:Uncharacterized protein n=1 Tax=Halobacterium jilantaiense TaxID=355548 RepID=A0A1I0Q9G9_9EURY|nr:hypothetical protein [Halobacterium jilantaiense]SEW23668.1 hypothetical protein SAMN04487945_2406 [Halobacterium jilantaiense]
MIVVATADFEVYHEVVGELRERDVEFTTIEPGDALPPGTDAVVTSDDDLAVDVPVVRAAAGNARLAVERAVGRVRGERSRTVVGVDPGDRPGIAVLRGGIVVAAFQVPVTDAAEVVREEVADDEDAVVRVGDGARMAGARILDELGDVTVELVDETGTTPHLGSGARGMGDVLAATNIALTPGEEVEGRSVDPTEGEIEVVKARSRERSEENRTITAELARRVAAGDLTLEEALAEHRDDA